MDPLRHGQVYGAGPEPQGAEGAHGRAVKAALPSFLVIIPGQSGWSQLTGGGSVTSMRKKGLREDPGSRRPVSLTLGPGEVLERIMVRVTAQAREDK